MELLFLVVICLWLLTDWAVVKKLNLKKQKWSPVNRLHKWFVNSFLVLFFFLIYYWVFTESEIKIYYLLFILILPFSVSAWFEWKYDRKTKRFLRTMVSGTFVVILTIIILIICLPENVSYTKPVYVYSEDDTVNEVMEMEITGELIFTIFYGDIFEGEIIILDKDFFLVRYGEKSEEIPIVNRLLGHPRYYMMVELDEEARGEVWISRDFQTYVGVIRTGDGVIRFASPAQSLEEAEELYDEVIE